MPAATQIKFNFSCFVRDFQMHKPFQCKWFHLKGIVRGIICFFV